MRSTPDLRLDWCSHEAASYAVTHWHYSRTMPKSKLAKIGAWEQGVFIGALIFGVGATPELCKPYRLKSTEVCELVRIALNKHLTPVSRMVSIALTVLHKAMPGLRVVVSFADTAHGHHGGIYQAGGWFYLGESVGRYIKTFGRVEHPRTLGLRYGRGGQSIPWLRSHVDPRAEQIVAAVKYRYVMPLDAEMRAKLLRLAQPYPKRGRRRATAATLPSVEGGVNPTRPLQP